MAILLVLLEIHGFWKRIVAVRGTRVVAEANFEFVHFKEFKDEQEKRGCVSEEHKGRGEWVHWGERGYGG